MPACCSRIRNPHGVMAGIIKRVRLDGPDRGAGKIDMLPRAVRHRLEDVIDDVGAGVAAGVQPALLGAGTACCRVAFGALLGAGRACWGLAGTCWGLLHAAGFTPGGAMPPL